MSPLASARHLLFTDPGAKWQHHFVAWMFVGEVIRSGQIVWEGLEIFMIFLTAYFLLPICDAVVAAQGSSAVCTRSHPAPMLQTAVSLGSTQSRDVRGTSDPSCQAPQSYLKCAQDTVAQANVTYTDKCILHHSPGHIHGHKCIVCSRYWRMYFWGWNRWKFWTSWRFKGRE